MRVLSGELRLSGKSGSGTFPGNGLTFSCPTGGRSSGAGCEIEGSLFPRGFPEFDDEYRKIRFAADELPV